MNKSETALCRLCAHSKPYNKLINILTDEDRRCKILEKLSRLNIVTNLDSVEDVLPKTVCFLCIESLDKAFDFVIGVETAQSELIAASPSIKNEASDDHFYDSFDEKFEESAVKVEEGDSKSEPESKSSESKVEKPTKMKKIARENSLDTLPLSQLKLSWRDYSWMCAYCETMFPDIGELKAHSIQFHGCCNAYRCTDCNIRKLKLDSFIIHVKRHRKYLKLSCYKCHKKFSRLCDASIHKTAHITSDYKCTGCNESFPTSEELTTHSEAYNKDKRVRGVPVIEQVADNNLTCVLCQKTFKYKGSLNTHLLTHTDRKRDHTCEKCGKCFLNKQNLAGHMQLHEDLRPHHCEICKHRFRTKSQLRAHIGVHNGAKPYSCEQCGRCFRLQKQLTSHMIIHTDSLPYVCTFCQKGFRFRSVLNEHVRQHTGVKPYSCQVCQRDFTNWPNYNKHMKRRHGMDMAKKKHTPDGLFPINPTTGEVMIEPQSNKNLEWMKKILDGPKGPGRPRIKSTNRKKENLFIYI